MIGLKVNFKLFDAQIIKYGNNRFCVKIKINKEEFNCYVPCSSKLNKYIKLDGAKCLVKLSNGKYKYSLFAVKYKSKYILIDTKMISFYYGEYFYSQKNVKFETYIEKRRYKPDLIVGKNQIIEVKSVISKSNTKIYPDENSIRLKEQLNIFNDIINKYNIELVFIFLNKTKIFSFTGEIQNLIKNLEFKGLKIKIYHCIFNNKNRKIFFKEINGSRIQFGI